jgi:hypothetical protein
MAVETFGVDQTHFAAYLPQIEVESSGVPLTNARLLEIIEGAAAEVAAAVVYTWGDVVSVIAADTGSTAYRNCQYCTIILATPHIIEAAHHLIDGEAFARLEERAENLRDRLFKKAARVIAYVPPSTPESGQTAGAQTSTQYLGIPLDQSSQRSRRRFGGRSAGGDEGGWRP